MASIKKNNKLGTLALTHVGIKSANGLNMELPFPW